MTYISNSQVCQNTLSDTTSERDWSVAEERKLLWRIDLRVLPMLTLVLGLCLLDRVNISLAYVAGMKEDLGLAVGARYSICLFVYFIGYIILQLPSNFVIRRIGPRLFLSFLTTAWGACIFGSGFVNDWRALAILRAFLGVFESGLFPGGIYLVSSWYREFELASRTSLFYGGSFIISGFGPIIAYGLSLVGVEKGMYSQGWRWIFIIEGAFTMAVGLVAAIFLVDFPERARFLNERQKHIAMSRLRSEGQWVTDIQHPNIREYLKMLLDWHLVAFAIEFLIQYSTVNSVVYYIPIILRGSLGFSYVKTQLLQSPPIIFAIIGSITTGWLMDRLKICWPFLLFQSLTTITGLLCILYSTVPGARYFGVFITIFGCSANLVGTLAYTLKQYPGQEKRGIVAAVMAMAGAVGGICGSTIFRSQDAPLYMPGMWATIAMQILYCILILGFAIHFRRQNKLADESNRIMLQGVEGFRYAL